MMAKVAAQEDEAKAHILWGVITLEHKRVENSGGRL
jgi:hypothetical protein